MYAHFYNVFDFNVCMPRHKMANRRFSHQVHLEDTICHIGQAPKTGSGQIRPPAFILYISGVIVTASKGGESYSITWRGCACSSMQLWPGVLGC